MSVKPYDTIWGIGKALVSLEALNKLFGDRHRAGYDRGERMEEYCVLGRWWLDSCGNCARIMPPNIPKEQFPDFPDVLTRDEFWAYIKTNAQPNYRLSWSLGDALPPATVRCADCGKYWNLDNCHDVVEREFTETLPLTDFIGKTLEEAQAFWRSREDGIYRFNGWSIRNDRYIDLTPNPEYETLKVNEHGWADEKTGIDGSYVIVPGDETLLLGWRLYHGECNRRHIERAMRERFAQLFKQAGFHSVELTAVPNQYCSCPMCGPWFEARTVFGLVTIGWRKRVIYLDWNKTGIQVNNVPEDSNITHGSGWTHAWGYEKAAEYLRTIRQAAQPVVA